MSANASSLSIVELQNMFSDTLLTDSYGSSKLRLALVRVILQDGLNEACSCANIKVFSHA